jgi:hypothetical protein
LVAYSIDSKKDHVIKKFLVELHRYYLKNNEYDEGDIIFHRINYRLMDTFELTKTDAIEFHKTYHNNSPRRISEGYCDNCKKISTIIPILYGFSIQDLEKITSAEIDGRLIIGDTEDIREGTNLAMFGCKSCRNPLPKYGTI